MTGLGRVLIGPWCAENVAPAFCCSFGVHLSLELHLLAGLSMVFGANTEMGNTLSEESTTARSGTSDIR